MAQERFTTLEVPTSVADGAAVAVGRLTDKTIQILGTFTATLQIEGTLDPGLTPVFAPIGAPVTAPGIVEIPGTYRQIRISTTAFTSGTPQAFLGGRDDRTR